MVPWSVLQEWGFKQNWLHGFIVGIVSNGKACTCRLVQSGAKDILPKVFVSALSVNQMKSCLFANRFAFVLL